MSRRSLLARALCFAGLVSAGAAADACQPPRVERPSGPLPREHLLVQSRLQFDGYGEVHARGLPGANSTGSSKADQAFGETVRRGDLAGEAAGGSPLQPASTANAVLGGGFWCNVLAPAADWQLKDTCARGEPRTVTVLTFNLNWWKLFGQMNGGQAAEVLAASAPYDFLGFQECDNVVRVLADARLAGDYSGIQGKHALAVAYRKSHWLLLDSGNADVAEDMRDQYYGRRGVQWARFQSRIGGRRVTFLNHHGPTPAGTGGRCGELATARNILRAIEAQAQAGDGVLLVGDFNAPSGTAMVRELESRLHKVYSGRVLDSVDHVFVNCGPGRLLSARNLGGGGSDHDALRVEIAF